MHNHHRISFSTNTPNIYIYHLHYTIVPFPSPALGKYFQRKIQECPQIYDMDINFHQYLLRTFYEMLHNHILSFLHFLFSHSFYKICHLIDNIKISLFYMCLEILQISYIFSKFNFRVCFR